MPTGPLAPAPRRAREQARAVPTSGPAQIGEERGGEVEGGGGDWKRAERSRVPGSSRRPAGGVKGGQARADGERRPGEDEASRRAAAATRVFFFPSPPRRDEPTCFVESDDDFGGVGGGGGGWIRSTRPGCGRCPKLRPMIRSTP